MKADETRRIWTVRLEHIACRSLIDEFFRFIDIRKFENGSRGQAKFAENTLGIGAVIFKTSTIGATSNNVQPFAPQTVLDLTVPQPNILEEDVPILTCSANPIELGFPIGHPFDEACERAPT